MVVNLLRRPAPTRTRRLPGAPRIPYLRPRREEAEPWRDVPPGWPGSNLEYAVWWYLTEHGIEPNRRKLKHGIDFFWQRAVNAPGLFVSRAFTRADFALPHWPGSRQGLILDPLYPFTHKSIKHDLDKRREVAKQGWLIVFIDGAPLLARPHGIIEAALDGRDLSARGRIGGGR